MSITAKSIRTEHGEQCAVIDWCRRKEGQHPELALIFAIPNGAALTSVTDARGRRYSPQAEKLKAEGMRAGVPDLFLPIPWQIYHGLFIEMKLPDGVVSKEQIAFMAEMNRLCYLALVCHSADEAIEAIKAYLGIE